MMRFEGKTTGFKAGMILEWSGAIVDIPTGFVLCDGNNSTPDLRNRFVPGAGDTYAPGDTGGAGSHTHTGTTSSTSPYLSAGAYISSVYPDGDYGERTEAHGHSIAADDNLPPWLALAYIMKT